MNHRTWECPTDVKCALYRYAREGWRTGDFLRAVLSNNLMLAVQLADNRNYLHLHAICQFVVHELPHGCWGSSEAVDAHLGTFADGRREAQTERSE